MTVDRAERVCPACGGPLRAWRTADLAEPPWTPVALLRCERCGSAVTDAPPPGPEAHETGAYAPGRPRGSRAAAPLLRAFDRARLRHLGVSRKQGVGSAHRAHMRKPGSDALSLLDVGAGRGRFVASARAAGWHAVGLEPSERGVAAAREVYGVDLVHGGLETTSFTAASFDAVVLWHVLEHLDDPAGALRHVRAWLRPGGTLLVGVPNLSSLQARLGGGRWYHFDLPRHRTHFTPAGLEELLTSSDFAVEGTSHLAFEHNPFGMWVSLVSYLTRVPSWLYQALKRNAPLRSRDAAVTALALPLAPAAALLELAAGLSRRGGTVAVRARRM